LVAASLVMPRQLLVLVTQPVKPQALLLL